MPDSTHATFMGCLEPGAAFRAFGEEHRVIAISGARIITLPPGASEGLPTTWLTTAVIAAPDFRILDLPFDEQVSAALLDELRFAPPDPANRAHQLAEHITEALTGFKSGVPHLALPHEPRDQFNPALNPGITDRLREKAAELNMSYRQLQRYRARLEDGGAGALVDGRRKRQRAPTTVDPRVMEAIEAVHARARTGQTIARGNFRRHVIAILRTNYPNVTIIDGERGGRVIQRGVDDSAEHGAGRD